MKVPARIALVGFMGSGKSTVGPILAARMGYRFVDSDDEIERRAGASVSEIFRQQGEPYFRNLERLTLKELLQEDARVIATGGGAFADPACADFILDRCFTILLHCDLAEVRRRIAGHQHRPLLEDGEGALARLYEERKNKYARARSTVDTTGLTPAEVATELLRIVSPSS